MESVACDLCGGDRLRVVYRQPDHLFFPDRWFDVVECSGCGLGFVNPRPTRAEIGEYYPAQFFASFAHHSHLARYAAEAKFLPPVSAGAKPRLLDIGCANGDFPRFVRGLGWQVEGVEVSSNADPITDFPVYRTDFPAIAVEGARYDAITAWAVLEHVHEPTAYFRKVSQLLKPGGRFAFLVTNFDSLSSRALFREDIPRHLYFFTPATLARFIDESRLRLVSVVHSREIFEMVPSNILYYAFCRYLRRRPLRWEDLPESRYDYIRRKTGAHGAHAAHPGRLMDLRYAMRYPMAALDRISAKLFERWQLWARRYGVVICTAEKPSS